MAKMLMIYPDRCTGCHNCELACTLFHDNEFRPFMSRIHVYSWEMEGFSIPTTCQHCKDAPCVAVCPTGAMHENRELNTVDWDVLKCIGCRMCTLACPFGAVVFDTERRRIVKCDMCGGDPECARFCPVSAIEYVEEGDATRSRKKAVAIGFKKTFEEVG